MSVLAGVRSASLASHCQRRERVMTPQRGLLFHITHLSNLASIAQHGLWCDSEMEASASAPREIGNLEIKEQRRRRPVPLPPGGSVADYVPFYFAARSPMLFSIHKGAVSSYQGGQKKIVYLVSSIDTIIEHELQFVFTDRNAALGHARYGDDPADLDEHIDWELMEARMWKNTSSEPDRMERRMAELLVHGYVPWDAITSVMTKTEKRSHQASAALTTVGATTPVSVQSDWYF